MILTFLLSNCGFIFAMYPSSVVHTGVKSRGCENRTAHESPIQSWKRILPSVVSASKSGAMSPICNAILCPPCLIPHCVVYQTGPGLPSFRQASRHGEGGGLSGVTRGRCVRDPESLGRRLGEGARASRLQGTRDNEFWLRVHARAERRSGDARRGSRTHGPARRRDS